MTPHVEIYDTTLRDGGQAEGVSYSLSDKLQIAMALDELGVEYLEGGWPNPTNEVDTEFFQEAAKLPLKHAKLVAFGSTCRADQPAADDVQLQALLAANTPAVTIYGKTWKYHVQKVLRVSLEQNLTMIREFVAFLKSAGRQVIYDAEHFLTATSPTPTTP